MDQRKRSWAKAITWRITGIILLGAIAYLFTGSLIESLEVTAVFTVVRLILYYVHERIWERVRWGKIVHPLAELPVKDQLTPEDLEVIRQKLGELGYL